MICSKGNHRTNFHGLDLNRQWHSPCKYTCPEVYFIQHKMQQTGVDLFFDTLGSNIADAVFDNLAKYATVLIVGRTNSNNSETPHLDYVNMRQLWAREARIQCFSRYSYPERWSFAREKMMKLCRDGRLKEIKTTAIGFENTPQALRDMLSGKALGKMIVKYSESVG